MNLYAYVGNDPVNMVDPTGKVGMETVRFDRLSGEQAIKLQEQIGSDVIEMTGATDLANAVTEVLSGDLSGAASSVVMAVNKPVKAATKASKLQQKVSKGQTPKGIKRFDSANTNVKSSQDHVHMKDGTSMNVDGTVHDKKNGVPSFSNKEQKFLKKEGWPTEPRIDD